MPTYTFKNNDTGQEWVQSMTISEKEQYLEDNKNITQLLVPVSFGDPVKLGIRKPDSNFRDVLREIKNKFPGSKGINTF